MAEAPEEDRVFELYEAKIPKQCERCKAKRPKLTLVRRLWGEEIKLAFVCSGCAVLLRKQASVVADRIRETLEANGGDVNVER